MAEPPPQSAAEDDADLVRRIAQAPGGAAAAEAELCRRLGPRVRLYGLKHLRSEAAAADLVQQVLLITLQRLRAGELREPERIASFVLGVSRMVVQDWRRGERRHERLLELYGPLALAGESPPGPPLDHERLRRCLEALPERERTVLIMTFYDERSAEEVGTELGLGAGNVRVIRHRAMSRLRTCVEPGVSP